MRKFCQTNTGEKLLIIRTESSTSFFAQLIFAAMVFAEFVFAKLFFFAKSCCWSPCIHLNEVLTPRWSPCINFNGVLVYFILMKSL